MPNGFVDTNILIYAAANDPASREKTLLARELLRKGDLALSTQVLGEFYWVATRPKKLGLSHDEALAFVAVWEQFPLLPVTLDTVHEALASTSRFQISYWDALILAAARQLGAKTLYSEDFNTGQDFDGVVVVDPFIS